MRMNRLLIPLAALALATPLRTAQAQQAPMKGWRAEFLAVMAQAEEKYVALAEATPADKLDWRPAPGVRSINEVYLHIAGANYGLVGRLGGSPPMGVDLANIEKMPADKANIVRHLKASFAHFRAAVMAFPEGDAEKMVPLFGGQQVTARHFLTFVADHNGEHLGQSIAYARMNGIKPPWSM
jgi:uncharacterized damage-inducible protein DinB